MLNLWKNKKTQIKVIKSYSMPASPWKSDAILFWVKNGKGRLKHAYGCANDKTDKKFLLLNGIPLVKLHSDQEYWCPTCEKLISAGYGLDKVNTLIMETIRNCTGQQYISIEKSFQDLSPLLGLLPTGCYGLADMELYPSNGNGEFYWSLTNKPQYKKGTSALFYRYHYMAGKPKYLIPTQTPQRFNPETVDKYRQMYRDGNQLRGLAYYMDDFLCALLDGHHRAIAACLENCKFRCLTILSISGLSYEPKAKGVVKSVYIGGEELPITDLPPKTSEFIKQEFGLEKRLSSEDVEKYLEMEASCWDDFTWPQELIEIGVKYPDVLSTACINWTGDLSEERVAQWSQDRNDDQLIIALKAMAALKDERAVKTAISIARNENLIDVWEDAFKYLSTIQSEEVEDFFIDFIVNDERIRPYLTKIADRYLEGRS